MARRADPAPSPAPAEGRRRGLFRRKPRTGPGRLAQMREVYRMTARVDPSIRWWMLGALVVPFVVFEVIGLITGRMVPPAPPEADAPAFKFDWHIVRASIRLVNATLHIPRLFLAIAAISFFWAMGAILAAQFPPLVKNVFHANEQVATLFLAIFSVGVAVGSVLINRLLAGRVLAVYSPASALAMGGFVLLLCALRHPGLFDRLVFADCGACFSEPGREAFRTMARVARTWSG